jgi:GTP-binding protein HflX
VILHVRDISHEDTEAQSGDVADVLRELGIAPEDPRLIEVWNKIDRLGADDCIRLANAVAREPTDRRPVLLSALSGEGLDQLAAAIETRLSLRRVVLDLALDPADGAGVSWLHRHTEVMAKSMRDDGLLAVTVRVAPAKTAMVQAKFGGLAKTSLS